MTYWAPRNSQLCVSGSIWWSNDIYGQKMAAEAIAGLVTVLRETVWDAGNEDECVGTDPPVLGRFESGSVWERQYGLIQTERERERGRERIETKTNTEQERWWQLLFSWGKKRMGGKINDWVVMDMNTHTLCLSQDGVEGSVYDLTHMEFLGHYRPEEEVETECVCGFCNESGSRGSQRNPLPAQSDAHTRLRI